MKKLCSLLLGVCALFCLTVGLSPKAEAARIAIVPLEQSENILVKNDLDLSIMYWDIANEVFKFPAFEVVSDRMMEKALPDGGLPDMKKETLERIAKETEADVVIAMRLDRIHEDEDQFLLEPKTKVEIDGEYASINHVTGKYYHARIGYSDIFETATLTRDDWRVNESRNLMRTYMKRTRDRE